MSVLRSEAFALPCVVERDNVEAHADMLYYTPVNDIAGMRVAIPVKGCEIYHIPRASTVAMFKTTHESCEVSERQEQSVLVNAFILCRDTITPHLPLGIGILNLFPIL